MGQNIFLIGYMGVGKSTLAQSIAKAIGYRVCDIDTEIELKEKRTISEIFAAEGETYFRSLELKIVKELLSSQNTVFATGGGLPCYNNLMAKLNADGITIYLKADPEQLAQRLKGQTEKRPLLRDIPQEELQKNIEQKLEQRASIYETAKIVYQIDLLDSVEKQTTELIELLPINSGD